MAGLCHVGQAMLPLYPRLRNAHGEQVTLSELLAQPGGKRGPLIFEFCDDLSLGQIFTQCRLPVTFVEPHGPGEAESKEFASF